MTAMTYSEFDPQSFTNIQTGCYQLILKLDQTISLEIGALCRLTLNPGIYLYTGRHRKSLLARISRHLKKEKSVYWHIDYFTVHPAIKAENVIIFPETDAECKINLDFHHLFNTRFLYRGLGSGDCKNKCVAHIQFIQNLSDKDINIWLATQAVFKPVFFSVNYSKLKEIHA